MKAIIEKKIEYFSNHWNRETLSDDISQFKTVTTTIYFMGIPIFWKLKYLTVPSRLPE